MEQSDLDDVSGSEKVSQEVASVSGGGSDLAAHVLAIGWGGKPKESNAC